MLNNKSRITLAALAALLLLCPQAFAQRRRAVVDLNLATEREFESLPGISSELSSEIVRYRELNNYFDSIEEILQIEGMTQELYEEISAYLIITSADFIRADEIIEELQIMLEEEEDYFLELDVDISRLEAYMASPLDINTAVYSQLLDLPGIDERMANRIIALRRELRGFESINDIREILGDYRFDRVRPFIAVLDETDLAQISGDIRVLGIIEYPYNDYYFNIPEKYHNPLQIEARHRLRYGNKLEFGFQMRRKASAHWPPDYDGALELNYGNFNNYFLGTRYLLIRNVGPADTVVLGSYRLDYFRPVTRTRRLRGLRIDERAGINSGFYGAAAEFRPGEWEFTVFASEKEFAISESNINEYDGSVGVGHSSFYDTGNYPIFEDSYLKESVYGGIVRRSFGDLSLGAGGYIKSFDRDIDHEGDFTRFRGDEINILDLEAEYTFRNYRFIADLGLSRYHTFDIIEDSGGNRDWTAGKKGGGRAWDWDTGNALRLTLLSNHERANFWAYYWRVDHDYYDYIGEGLAATYNGRNEIRYSLGGRIAPRRGISTQAEIIYQEPLIHLSPAAHDYQHRSTIKVRQSWDVTDKFLLRYTGSLRSGSAYRGLDAKYLYRNESSHRLEIIHRASDRIRFRCVLRKSTDKYPEISDLRDYDTEAGNYAEVRYRPTNPLVILARASVQEGGHGVGWSIRPVYTFSQNARLRMDYQYEPRNPDTRGFQSFLGVQYDMSW